MRNGLVPDTNEGTLNAMGLKDKNHLERNDEK
jgi:hypothetical protein